MTKNILKMAGIGLIIVVVVAAVLYFANRGAQIRLSGTIQQVRIQAMDARSCVVIVDFRFQNPADYPFIVKNAIIHLDTAEGLPLKGSPVAAMDAKRVFDYYSKTNPDLGVQYNEMLIVRDRVEPKETMDRMVMARFEIPADEAAARSRLRLRIQDVDGAITEITEERDAEAR